MLSVSTGIVSMVLTVSASIDARSVQTVVTAFRPILVSKLFMTMPVGSFKAAHFLTM